MRRARTCPRILAESDVFVKYGLLDRAVDHLRRAFEIQPDYLPAREKLAAVLTQLGRRTEAAAELEYMAEHLAETDRAQALKLAERARVLDPAAAGVRWRCSRETTASFGSPRPGFLHGPNTAISVAAIPALPPRRAPPSPAVDLMGSLDDDGIEMSDADVAATSDDLELDLDLEDAVECGGRSPGWIW